MTSDEEGERDGSPTAEVNTALGLQPRQRKIFLFAIEFIEGFSCRVEFEMSLCAVLDVTFVPHRQIQDIGGR